MNKVVYTGLLPLSFEVHHPHVFQLNISNFKTKCQISWNCSNLNSHILGFCLRWNTVDQDQWA